MGEEGRYGSQDQYRTFREAGASERRGRTCACGNTVTHVGLGGGVALIAGCEWCVRKWVQDPNAVPGEIQ